MIDRKNTKMPGSEKGLSDLLHYGQKQGHFKDFDIMEMAIHILLLLDSLETSAVILGIDNDSIEKQFKMIYNMVLKS